MPVAGLRFAFWAITVVVATAAATFVIFLSAGARPDLFGPEDISRRLGSTEPVAGPPEEPASPGDLTGGAGHNGDPTTTAAPRGAVAGTGAGAVAGSTASISPTGGGTPAGGAGAGAGGAGAGPTATVTATGSPAGTLLVSTGGSVVATCAGTTVTLQSWTPNAGYRGGHVQRGPAAQASLEFESDTADDVLVVLTCPNGLPTLSEQPADSHGGGGGKGGPG